MKLQTYNTSTTVGAQVTKDFSACGMLLILAPYRMHQSQYSWNIKRKSEEIWGLLKKERIENDKGVCLSATYSSLKLAKTKIPFGRKLMLEAYADILFRAWKVGEGLSREEIENGFSRRTTDGVKKLLFRLSEPVIFRSLQVANSNVRKNALHLLLDMFPLEDPDATEEVKDALLDKQFFLLEKLLLDECPNVRVVAVEVPHKTFGSHKAYDNRFESHAHEANQLERFASVFDYFDGGVRRTEWLIAGHRLKLHLLEQRHTDEDLSATIVCFPSPHYRIVHIERSKTEAGENLVVIHEYYSDGGDCWAIFRVDLDASAVAADWKYRCISLLESVYWLSKSGHLLKFNCVRFVGETIELPEIAKETFLDA
ncbi:hypothetical protein IFM89_029378 [Coptis chinensis]|uniref:Uncharacterized protein n=1 Tax=Coptis chinensis TaxID=261450 RepID=A0A835IRK0_9MAGN|nr:hypothetical protein IFM89_029378 [Coptis chinensis]